MSTPTRGYNLLENRLIASFLRSRWYPAIFQWVTSAAFVLIMWQLLVGPDSAHSNAGTALTWVLWWPVIPILFVLMGRFWCAICPFAALSDAVQKLVGNHRRAPEFLKKYGIWIIDALFILITWSDHVWGIVESPWGSGMLLLLLTTGVVISGAFFERRTWCRYLCFLGGLSGNYARVGMLELRVTPEVCAKCTSRAACFNGSEQGRGCPLFEFPRTMESSANCNLCASCIKVCPHNAITLTVRPPTHELWFIRKPKLEEAFLAVVIMGIVFIQNITMLEMWQGLLAWLERSLGITSYPLIFTITFLIAMAAPVALMAGAARLASRANGATVAKNFARFGYAIIPLDVAGHIAHNLFHLLAEGKAVLFTTLALFGQRAGEQPTALLGTAQIQLLQYALVGLGVAGSIYAALRIARSSSREGERTWASFAPYAALIVLLGAVNISLFILPMASRM